MPVRKPTTLVTDGENGGLGVTPYVSLRSMADSEDVLARALRSGPGFARMAAASRTAAAASRLSTSLFHDEFADETADVKDCSGAIFFFFLELEEASWGVSSCPKEKAELLPNPRRSKEVAAGVDVAVVGPVAVEDVVTTVHA